MKLKLQGYKRKLSWLLAVSFVYPSFPPELNIGTFEGFVREERRQDRFAIAKSKMRRPSPHSDFFSSLKQVEKRLKLEKSTAQPTNLSPPTPTPTEESLSSPIYLQNHQTTNNNDTSSTLQESSEAPLAFLSSSSLQQSSAPTHQNPLQEIPQEESRSVSEDKRDDLDDIGLLMQLLGVSDFEEGNQEREREVKERPLGVAEGDGDGDGFYEKIVGVKGPKCEKEVERLERWIKYFLTSGGEREGDGEERREPLRLAFLLMGKAAFELQSGGGGGAGGGYGEFEFPSTIEEFLKFDPPSGE